MKITLKGEKFLYWDSFDDDKNLDRIIVFSTQKNLDNLSLSDVWIQDGTFKAAPRIFKQLYTIHAQVDGVVCPLVYAFLQRKDQETYKRLFQSLEKAPFPFNPQFILMDYEIAAIKATQDIFPPARISGCLFHFGDP
jgi:MULE transposase domain